MTEDALLLQQMYERFNARDIDGVLTALTDDVAWANAMDGGHVYGKDAIRDYWMRQWAVVSPNVEPLRFALASNGAIVVEVRQTIFDLEGQPVENSSHGLRDKTVEHVFRLREGKVSHFDVREVE